MDFANVFDVGGPSGRTQAGGRIAKRLSDSGRAVGDRVTGVGKPIKIAKLSDIRDIYPNL